MDFIPQSHFDLLKTSGLLVDGIGGGFVLAGLHEEMDAGMIKENRGKFEIYGRIEGWEFLINPYATKRYWRRLLEINDELKDSRQQFEKYEIPAETKTIDLMPVTVYFLTQSKFLFLGSQNFFIINKHSTKKYIKELNLINSYNIGLK